MIHFLLQRFKQEFNATPLSVYQCKIQGKPEVSLFFFHVVAFNTFLFPLSLFTTTTPSPSHTPPPLSPTHHHHHQHSHHHHFHHHHHHHQATLTRPQASPTPALTSEIIYRHAGQSATKVNMRSPACSHP